MGSSLSAFDDYIFDDDFSDLKCKEHEISLKKNKKIESRPFNGNIKAFIESFTQEYAMDKKAPMYSKLAEYKGHTFKVIVMQESVTEESMVQIRRLK